MWDTHAKKLALAKVDESSTCEPWSICLTHAGSEVQINLCAQGVRELSPETTDTMEIVAGAAAAADSAADVADVAHSADSAAASAAAADRRP